MQQFCDIFGKKGDAWHMILGDTPAGHGFVLRDLVLIDLFEGMHPRLQLGGGGGVKKLRKSLLCGGSEILILVVGGNFVGRGGGGHVILK